MNLLVTLIVILLMWDVFWFLTDPRPFYERLKFRITLTWPRVALVIFLQALSALFFPLPPTQWDKLIILSGIMIYGLGLLLSLWAKITMGTFWGPPAQHDIRRQNNLVIKAPFSFTRNPIYVGVMLIVLGFSLAVRSGLFFLIIFLFLYLRNAVIKEEKLLEKHFGKKYLDYKSRVPRFLIF